MKIYALAFLFFAQQPFACHETPDLQPSPLLAESPAGQDSARMNQDSLQANEATMVFRSVDGGLTWQDISAGLSDQVREVSCFGDESGLYVRIGHELFHTEPHASTPYWTHEMLPDPYGLIAPGNSGIVAFNSSGQFSQRTIGIPVWSSVYSNFPEKSVHTVFETDGGIVLIGTDNGIYKSSDKGNTWKQVNSGGWVRKVVEANGVLLATSQGGILRSTDKGEHWDYVVREGGVGIDVECIKGGFAAINYNTESKTRRIRASYDGGLTWKAIDAGLPPTLSISSIVEVNGYFFCGHPKGIYQSTDKGKTWKLIVPSVANKVFNLFVSGGVLYAVPMAGGC